jgi:hypothetical protein
LSGPGSERRQYQRATLIRPLAGRIGTSRVFIVDISLSGVRIAHQGTIPSEGSTCKVSFEWESMPVTLECRVTRSTLYKLAKTSAEKSVYHAGLQIVRATDYDMATLRTMITALVARALDEQKANARGIPAAAAQTFQTGKGSQFLRLELLNGEWRQTETTRADQPMNGFTVSAEEERDHVRMLCETYAAADADGRKLIKLMAELSISKAEGIPTRRYVP